MRDRTAAMQRIGEDVRPRYRDHTQEGNPDKNKGSSSKVKLKDDPGTGEDRVGFGKFDLSTLPSNVDADDIIKATLRMWIRKVSREGSIDVELVVAGALPLHPDLPGLPMGARSAPQAPAGSARQGAM